MDQTHTKIWILFQFTSGPWRPILGKKSTISCKLGPPEAKLWYRIFFYHENGGMHEIWAFSYFSSKTGGQK